MEPNNREDFLQRLIRKATEPQTMMFIYPLISASKDIKAPPLLQLLMMEESLLTEEGKEAITFLETALEDPEQAFTFEQFKWKVTAFVAIQDLITTPFHTVATVENFLQLKYFYYESKYILMEMVASSLNGLHVANKQLSRNFLEFNLLQCYFVSKIKNDFSFAVFNDYLKTRVNPSLHKLINGAVPTDNFCKPIKKRIQIEMDNLSNRYSHAYSQDDSPKTSGIYRPGLTIDSLYFYVHAGAILDLVLWVYYVNFPLLFQPVDIIKKFGFSPPALFVTKDVTAIIKNCLTTEDFTLFEEYASQQQEAIDTMNWYHSQPDLSEDEIWATLDKPRTEDDTFEGCFLQMMVKVRAYSEFLIESKMMKEEKEKRMEAVTDEVVASYNEFSKWRKVYKKL